MTISFTKPGFVSKIFAEWALDYEEALNKGLYPPHLRSWTEEMAYYCNLMAVPCDWVISDDDDLIKKTRYITEVAHLQPHSGIRKEAKRVIAWLDHVQIDRHTFDDQLAA